MTGRENLGEQEVSGALGSINMVHVCQEVGGQSLQTMEICNLDDVPIVWRSGVCIMLLLSKLSTRYCTLYSYHEERSLTLGRSFWSLESTSDHTWICHSDLVTADKRGCLVYVGPRPREVFQLFQDAVALQFMSEQDAEQSQWQEVTGHRGGGSALESNQLFSC